MSPDLLDGDLNLSVVFFESGKLLLGTSFLEIDQLWKLELVLLRLLG